MRPPGTSQSGRGSGDVPPKRHSQYLRNAVNLLGSPGLEKQLEELVQNFIVEDKVRRR
jgi:hypothetical protein